MNRRQAILSTSTLLAGSVLSAKKVKQTISLNSTYSANHKIIDLPFNPKSLKSISEKVIVSHHKNNYSGAVKKLNLIQKQIVSLPTTSHPIEHGALKKEELIALNSKLLHELYFENLGGTGIINQGMQEVLVQGFGSIKAWENDFIKTAKSLSGGSGWVILTYLKEQQVLMHQIGSDHSDTTATGVPLLVLDMYEHAYHMDYGTNTSKYIEAFIQNLNWDIVLQRLKDTYS